MDKREPLSTVSTRFRGPIWQFLLCQLAPAVLLLATVATSLAAGARAFGGGQDWFTSLLQGSPFAISLLLAIGAHAFGHYIAARRNGISACLPYFIPAINTLGTTGAYTKFTWPIDDRRALIQIFAAGPIAGCAVSAALFFFGLTLSEVASGPPSPGIAFGESLLTSGMQRFLFPDVMEDQDIALHPMGVAGWFGLFFNLWHLFPAGRLDGGRLVYALWGYRINRIVSWLTIATLIALSAVWVGWIVFALLPILSMVQLNRQHPIERHEERLDWSTVSLTCAPFIVLVFTFVPTPTTFLP